MAIDGRSVLDAWNEGWRTKSRAKPWVVAGLAAFTLLYVSLCWYFGPTHRWVFFREGRLIDWLSSAYLSCAAIGFAVAFARGRRSSEAGSWVWAVVALGFCVLTLDERFQVHERLGRGFHGGPLGLRNSGDFLLMLYGVVAASAAALTVRTLLRCPSAPFVIAGFGLYVSHTLTDAFMDPSSLRRPIEESFKVMASASFGMAALVAAFRDRPTERDGPGPRGIGGMSSALLVAANLLVATLVWSVGESWNSSAPTPWRSPAAWISSVYFWAASWLCWTLGPPGGGVAQRLGSRALALLLGVAGLALGMSGWRDMTEYIGGQRFHGLVESTAASLSPPVSVGVVAVVLALALAASYPLDPGRRVRSHLAAGAAMFASEAALGLVAPTLVTSHGAILRISGAGFVLLAVLHRIFESRAPD